MKNGDFKINGKMGMLELNSFLESYPAITIPKRKKTFQAIEGANTQAILDENAYDNREIDLSIIVRADNELDRTMRVSALVSAFDSPGYIDFTYYGEPNFNYRITNAEVISQERVTRISYWTHLSLKLSAGAFKYYKPDTVYEFGNETLKLFNKFDYIARPLISTSGVGFILGTESSTSISLYGYKYNNPGGVIYIDSDEEQQDVYNAAGVIENAYKIGQEFPILYPGMNVITGIGPGNSIQPRWRTI